MSEVSRTLPKILITNDDGIESVLLSEMIARLAGKFRIIVAAPANERSFCGRSFTFGQDVEVKEVQGWPCQAFAVDGTPSDCVNIALGHLCGDELPDLVLSGPNIGRNTSIGFISGSGTVAGALEGAFWGIRALAVSQGFENNAVANEMKRYESLPESFQPIFDRGLDVVEIAIERCMSREPTRLCVDSLNLPYHYADGENEILDVPPVDYDFGCFFTKTEDGRYTSGAGKRTRITAPETLTDIDCVSQGKAAWTRLDFSRIYTS
ncbi:MAG: 5'/3'-nucleotidase SurE [Opitutales bacterium]